jgi:molybdate transport system substrate-binding protein
VDVHDNAGGPSQLEITRREIPMKIRALAAGAIAISGIILLFAAGVPAQAPAVRVLASNGVQGAVSEIIPQCEHAIGHPLAVEFGTTASIKPRIEGGEAFDFTILTADAIDGLIKEGKVAADSRASVARVGIGIGIKAGAAKPDIGTPEALRKALLNAKSITYAAAGASRPPTDKMLASMGIADALKSKTLLLSGAEETAAAVRDGKAEILITLISEIMSAKGLALAGPLPKEFQAYIGFAAGVSPNAKNAEAAKAAVKYLTGPKAAAAYKAKGMEPGK